MLNRNFSNYASCWGAVLLWAVAFAGDVFAEGGRPFIWRVSDENSHFYLLGSIHVLRPSDHPLRAIYETVYNQVDRVAVEVDIVDLDQELMESLMLARATYSGSRTLRSDLSVSGYNTIRNYLVSKGLQMVDTLKPWVYSSLIEDLISEGADFKQGDGVDMHFLLKAKADRKPVIELETAAQSIGIFIDAMESLPVSEIEKGIIELISDPSEYLDGTRQLIDVWRDGTLDQMELYISEDSSNPEFDKLLLGDRNRNWMPALDAFLANDEKAMVIVGAAHLMGDDGLLSLLAAQGYSIQALPEQPWIETTLEQAGTDSTLVVSGSMGRRCVIERSADLDSLAWETIDTVALTDEGREIEIELIGPGRRFVRARLLPE